jgi:hypothetical protein
MLFARGSCGSPSLQHMRGGCGGREEGGWSRGEGLRSQIARGASRGGEEEGGGQHGGRRRPGSSRHASAVARRRGGGFFFQFRVGSDMEGKGGPYGYIGWVCVGWVRKKFRFWQKHSSDYDFFYFVVLPPYPLPKTYDGWVRH